MRRSALLGLAVALLAAASPARAQPADSLATARPAALADSLPAPATALRRSLLVPGWGQLTNRRPVRAVIAGAATVGAVAYLVVQQRQYVRYRRAALYAGCQETPDRDVCADVAYAEAAWLGLGSPPFATVAPVRDAERGQRDVAGLLVGLVYAVQALDAYVGAHLADFDVSEDLSVRLAPAPSGPTLAARWRWSPLN